MPKILEHRSAPPNSLDQLVDESVEQANEHQDIVVKELRSIDTDHDVTIAEPVMGSDSVLEYYTDQYPVNTMSSRELAAYYNGDTAKKGRIRAISQAAVRLMSLGRK